MRNLAILARILAASANMKVVFQNTATAACDGKRVIIPTNWGSSADKEAPAILEGVLDHEALGHGRFTDFEAFKAYAVNGQLHKTVLNILEDIYIETRAIQAKPGVQRNLSKLVEILHARQFFSSPIHLSVASGSSLLCSALLNVLRYELLPGQGVLKANADVANATAKKAFGDLWDKVLVIARRAATSRSTTDNVKLTEQIMALIGAFSQGLPEPKPEPKPKGGQGDDQAGDDSDAGDGEPGKSGEKDKAGKAKSKSKSKSKKCGSGDPGAEAGADGGGDEQCDTGEPEQTSSAGMPNDKAVAGAKAIISTMGARLPRVEVTEGASEQLNNKTCSADITLLERMEGRKPLSNLALQVACRVNHIADDLKEALMAHTMSRKTVGLEGRRLDPRALHRLKSGSQRVFMRKEVGRGVSTAVTILVDSSASMKAPMSQCGAGSGPRSDFAIGAAFGLGNILDEFDIPFSLGIYSDCLAIVHQFDAHWQGNFKKGVPVMAGGTGSGAAMTRIMGDLAVRPEERRLVIFLTDGDPRDQELLMATYAEAVEQGIEVATVIIGDVVPKVEMLAKRFDFKVTSCTDGNAIAPFVLERVLEAI